MGFRVLREADGDISAVSMLDKVRSRSVLPEDKEQYAERDEQETVHVHDECLVRARWFEVPPDRNLRFDVLRLFVESEGEYFNEWQCEFSTSGINVRGQFQLAIEKRYFFLQFVVYCECRYHDDSRVLAKNTRLLLL